jgi:multiple sugar transport system ATP-binding protein
MNFLRVQSDGTYLSFGTRRLPLTDEVLSALRRREGEMILGLRPEHFTASIEGSDETTVPVTVEITEQLGSETLVYFRIDDVSAEELGTESEAELRGALVARLDPRVHPAPGQRLHLVADVQRAHFFDPADGASLKR